MEEKLADDSSRVNIQSYPVYAVDGYGPNRLLLSSSMLFNDVIDAQVLKTSLERLIQIGEWRKLAGRLQEKVIDEPVHPTEQPLLNATEASVLTVS